ncbi:hypothetical protein Hypma_007431 [Hypsizygus marmoreus]|uniref:Uncharacterized protein n=1 Tax=Hypsizygus marmoreus TaxID=39966 RepID=A0A369JSW6_HYPMA|nr:hypothetical protein Hypma_007431 [Hypsizygus marmoreus]
MTRASQATSVCPPLRKALSSPSVNVTGEREAAPFPHELQSRAAAAKQGKEPERWMRLVTRREVLKHAVGRIVHVQRVSGTIQSTPP